MFADIAVEELLRTIAANLETTVLPALGGRGERRQCRTAVYLIRAVANALPELDDVIAADIEAFAPLVGGADDRDTVSSPPDAAGAQLQRQRRDDLTRAVSDAIADADSDIDRAAARAAIRASLDRWASLFPPGELGAYVNLDHSPVGDATEVP